MPFWPCQYTGGVLVNVVIFSPCGDASQMGPIFSVISMRPSGRKAKRHGNSNVLTVVMLKGMLASGFCSPALTWAQAPAEITEVSNAAFANLIFDPPCIRRILGSGTLLFNRTTLAARR